MSLDAVADELYGLPPEDFTAARHAATKADPALRTEVAALRRPTVSAWLVNLLAREERETLETLLELGPALAEAQRTGAGAELRALGEQRRALLAGISARAAELAGREVSAAVRLEVEATIEAALADPAAAEAVRSGRLVRALSFSGFGGTDLEGATATAAVTATRGTTRPRARAAAVEPPDDRLERIARLERAAHQAAGGLDDAVREATSTAAAAEAAEAELRESEEAVTRSEEALAAARARRTAAKTEAAEAATQSRRAERGVAAAQAAAEQARQALDAARRS